MGSVWKAVKATYQAVDALADKMAGVDGGNTSGLCTQRGRKSGNKECGEPLKPNQDTCGHKKCAAAWMNMHEATNGAVKKVPLIQNASRLTGHRETLGRFDKSSKPGKSVSMGKVCLCDRPIESDQMNCGRSACIKAMNKAMGK